MDVQETDTGRREATNDEIKHLPHVVDSLPAVVWIALVAGAADRFTYYAVTTPWQNYMQNSHDSIANPGALGLGQSTATKISNAFMFFSYLTPVPFAILSDVWLGRYKTLCIGFLLNFCGGIALFVTSLPNVTALSVKVVGLVLAMVFMGLGTGAIKATVTPFIGDQYTSMAPELLITKKGERVVTDRTLTLQYIYNVYFWFINIASLSLLASTYLEREVGFWAAYLLPLCSFWISIPLLLFRQKAFVKLRPQGNVLPQAAKVLTCSARHRFNLDAAKPAFQAEKYGRTVEWSNGFVSEIRSGLVACKVLFCFIPFSLCMNQTFNNLISQAGQMRSSGFPNDGFLAIDCVACIVLGPVIQFLYPIIRKRGIPFGPITRMATSFIIMSIGIAYAAGLQRWIYSKGPCYESPLACSASDNGRIPNNISVWLQTPVWVIIATAEIVGLTTVSEYSYSKAPKDMRSLVQALQQVSIGIAAAIGIALSPVAVDPKVMYLYAGMAVAMLVSAIPFWLAFGAQDKAEDNNQGLKEPPRRDITLMEETTSTA